MARDRVKAEAKGRVAEVVAIALLTAKGYALIRRRYKSPSGEIDLIMRRGDVTAFIEVKARSTHDEAVASVSHTQARLQMSIFPTTNNKPNHEKTHTQ